jgi:O-acetyl-ADP-ribose deacetylase (regulator of RNase III)
LRGSTAHALRIASQKGLRTIAIPAIGTGIGGFPLSECAEIMLHEAVEHLKRPSTLEQIRFVLFDSKALAAFEKAIHDMKERGELAEAQPAESA